ncbi:MAG: lysozyme inhibitor LprI family protein [Pseudomonadota bacterium]
MQTEAAFDKTRGAASVRLINEPMSVPASKKDANVKMVCGAVARSLLLLFGLGLPTLAAAGPRPDCFGFDHLDDDPFSLELYQVQPGDKVAFECPEKSVLCRKGAFVVPGDQVVVSRVDGDRACADYLSPVDKRDGETAGWLPLARLTRMSPAPDWSGRWGDREIAIVAKPQGDKIRIDAQAKLGFGHGTEYGQFAALVEARQSQAKFGYEAGEDGHEEKLLAYQDKAPAGVCQVKIAQLGRYLVVGDNRMCGGVNVSFSRVYRRINEVSGKAVAPQATAVQAGADGLRSSYQTCLDQSGGVTSAMQDCIGAEYRYQDGRLNKVYRAVRDKLDQAKATQLRDEQRRWIAERDKACAPEPDGGTAAMLSANDCALERTAKRAAELEARLSR